jgi:hypothetical protein
MSEPCVKHRKEGKTTAQYQCYFCEQLELHTLKNRITELEGFIRDLPCVGCEAPGLECDNCRIRREALGG